MKINFGCGRYPRDGWVNVDVDARVSPDVVHDLEALPYPFETGVAEEISASHVLEHLTQPFEVMAEWARILKPGGRLVVKVPHFSRGFTHPDHKRGFDVSFPFYFNEAHPPFFMGTALELDRVRLTWFAQPWLKKQTLGASAYWFGRTVGAWCDFWANLSPFAASRLWGFWIGGFEEIEFRFRKPMPPML